MTGMTFGAAALIVLVGVALIVWPVQIAAKLVGARHSGLLRCLLAVIVSNVLHGIGLAAPVLGSLVAFLLSAVAFMVLLGTGYLSALVIAVLEMVLLYVIGIAIVVLFGSALGVVMVAGA